MQNNDTRQKIYLMVSGFFFLFFIILMFGLFFVYYTDNTVKKEHFYENIGTPIIIKDNVRLEASDGSIIVSDLPVKLDSNRDYSITFIPIVDESSEPTFINIRSSYTSYVLTCGDEVIGNYQVDKKSTLKSMASSINFFEIPNNLLGKEFTLTFSSNVQNKSGIKIIPVMYGTKISMLKEVYRDNLPQVLFFLLFFVIALLLLIAYIVSYVMKIHKKKGLIISAFLFNMAITILFHSWFAYYHINNMISYYVESIFININFIPFFLLFIDFFSIKQYFNWHYKAIRVIVIILSINALVQFVLTFLSISEFIIMRPLTQIIYILAFVLFLIIIFTMDKQQVKEKYIIILSTLPLSCSVILISYEYFISDEVSYKIFFIVSVIIFLLFQLLIEIRKNFGKYILSVESSLYKELAYVDSLSKLYNRHAFDKDMRILRSRDTFYKTMLFIMADINGLKKINDELGHVAGDLCIKACGEILMDIQDSFAKTYAYRYAGDEFFLVSYDKDYKQTRKILKKIDENISNYSYKHQGFKVSIALGYSFVELDRGFSLSTIMTEVDQKMYNDKKIKKEASYV